MYEEVGEVLEVETGPRPFACGYSSFINPVLTMLKRRGPGCSSDLAQAWHIAARLPGFLLLWRREEVKRIN